MGELVRIGRDYDGGYIMLEEFVSSMIAYSFGISDDVSWEKDMAKRGIHSFMYDHTINGLPENNEIFHWEKRGICGSQPIELCKTLEEFIEFNGHAGKKDLILKMEVEGAEWDVLESVRTETLASFSQVVLELHDMNNPALYNQICSVLSKLGKTHQCVHVHGNNYRSYQRIGNLVVPDVLEVLYVRKHDHIFESGNHFYPRYLDMPNSTLRNDIVLGVWNND